VSKFVRGIPNGSQITIRQLFNHTSGLPNYTENLRFQLRTVLLHTKWSTDDILEIIRHQKPTSEPGSRHYYSNSNYGLLGKVAEAAGAVPFPSC